jgi:hypothetical protein
MEEAREKEIKVKVRAPSGAVMYWPSESPIPNGFTIINIEDELMEAASLEIKLLTCSPETWAKTQRREITAYELVELSSGDYPESIIEAKRKLRYAAASAGCEVIVNTQMSIANKDGYFIGTGLRLQKQDEEKKSE